MNIGNRVRVGDEDVHGTNWDEGWVGGGVGPGYSRMGIFLAPSRMERGLRGGGFHSGVQGREREREYIQYSSGDRQSYGVHF